MSVFRRDISIDTMITALESTVCSVYRVCAMWRSIQIRYDQEVVYFILYYVWHQLLYLGIYNFKSLFL